MHLTINELITAIYKTPSLSTVWCYRVRIRFSVWSVSGYAHVLILPTVVIVTTCSMSVIAAKHLSVSSSTRRSRNKDRWKDWKFDAL